MPLLPLITHPSLGYDAPLPASLIADVARLGVAGDVYLQLPPQSRTERGLSHVRALLSVANCRVGAFLPSEADAAAAYLDAGALAVAFDVNTSGGEASVGAAAEALASLPRQRLLVYVHEGAAAGGGGGGVDGSRAPVSTGIVAALTALRELVMGVIVAAPEGEIHSEFHKALRAAVDPHTALCLRPSAQTLRPSDVGRLHRHDVGVLFPAGVATTPEEVAAAEANAAVESLDAGACLAACVRSDRPDGLFTTVVADECGRALGLVYSNGVSVAESIRCGRGVYYSRSR